MVAISLLVHLMVPSGRYFVEMSTLLNYFKLKDGLLNPTHLATGIKSISCLFLYNARYFIHS